ncbi:MAG: exodeoxyribonuclease V subunit gamma, partial [Pseudomonadota bacterium]|nr:exodeoxyribonuclease V subunit gamma [Pseudomonadota bacterium]
APVGGWRVGHAYEDGRIRLMLALWVEHLWHCAVAAEPAPAGSMWCLREGRAGFRALAPDEARARLAELLSWYGQGLCQPLHFFPRSAESLLESGPAAARRTWLGSGGGVRIRGESHDAAWRILMRGVADPLAGSFAGLAQGILGPLREARQ